MAAPAARTDDDDVVAGGGLFHGVVLSVQLRTLGPAARRAAVMGAAIWPARYGVVADAVDEVGVAAVLEALTHDVEALDRGDAADV